MATRKTQRSRGVGGDGREYNAGYKRNPKSIGMTMDEYRRSKVRKPKKK